jgi:transaldolase
MKEKGARYQRLLWASTGSKNPKFGELKYVEPLIARDTVTNLPVKTFEAYREQGNPTPSMERETARAE